VDPSVIAGKLEIVQQERAKGRTAEEAALLVGGAGQPGIDISRLRSQEAREDSKVQFDRTENCLSRRLLASALTLDLVRCH
jgi:hypothetical protein